MAPEVYYGLPYGLSVDVFSYGLLLWNLCYLRTPFGDNLTLKKHHKHVMKKGSRPKRIPSKQITDELWTLMSMCWSTNREDRPCFEIICDVLRDEIKNLRTDMQMSSPLPDEITKSSSLMTMAKQEATSGSLASEGGLGRQGSSAALSTHTTRVSNASQNNNTSSSGPGSGKLSRMGSLPTLFGSRQKKKQDSAMDAINMSSHGLKWKMTRIRRGLPPKPRDGSNIRKSISDKLFHIRNSNLEERSDYLTNKSLQSLADLQSSSANLLQSSLSESRNSSRSARNSGFGFSQRVLMFGEGFQHGMRVTS